VFWLYFRHVFWWCKKMWTIPWLRILATSLLLYRPGFIPRLVHVGIVVKKTTLVQGFLWVLSFCLSVSFHWCSIFIHSFMCCWHCVNLVAGHIIKWHTRARTLKTHCAMLISLTEYLQNKFRIKSCFSLNLLVIGSTTIQ